MLRVIELFAKSLKITQSMTPVCKSLLVCLYLVPFLRHLASNNNVTLKSGSGLLKIIENGTIRKRGMVSYLHSIYGFILYHFRDKARYWWKIAIFSHLLHSTPPSGSLRWDVAIWFGKTRMVWLPHGERKLRTPIDLFAVSTEPVCDRQPDGQTDGHLATA